MKNICLSVLFTTGFVFSAGLVRAETDPCEGPQTTHVQSKTSVRYASLSPQDKAKNLNLALWTKIYPFLFADDSFDQKMKDGLAPIEKIVNDKKIEIANANKLSRSEDANDTRQILSTLSETLTLTPEAFRIFFGDEEGEFLFSRINEIWNQYTKDYDEPSVHESLLDQHIQSVLKLL